LIGTSAEKETPLSASENSVRVDLGSRSYDIVIGQNLLGRAGGRLVPLLPSKKICVVTDETVAKLYLVKLMRALEEGGFKACPPVILPTGESIKGFEHLQHIVEKTLSFKLDRNSTLLALGGGVIGDITGFTAAILMRGIGFVQMPTTLLSQVDSSIGGKTGINTAAGKNLVGAFYHPKVVLIDTDVLQTLPPRELKAGYAEILKYALINDAAFFGWLEENGTDVLEGDASALAYAIDKSCRSKVAIVQQDEDERKDIRALLNLGHSFGHALEAIGGYDGRLLHGEAVGIGMLLAFEFSKELGLCPASDVERLRRHLSASGLTTEPPFKVTAAEILARMRGDKKNRDDSLTLILTKGIGKAFVARGVDEAQLAAFLRKTFG
jgi:3-dehydroquinate synthase